MPFNRVRRNLGRLDQAVQISVVGGWAGKGKGTQTTPFLCRAGSNFLICYQFFTCGGATSPVPSALRGWQEKNTHARRVGVALWIEFNRDISYRGGVGIVIEKN